VARAGLVDDWTTHHLIFSNPGTAVEALAQGRVAQWYRTITDPRYVMQQMKRNPAPPASATPQDFAPLAGRLGAPVTEMVGFANWGPARRAASPQRDWAFSLGSGTVAQNMFPAKFTFNINATPSCTSDFVVYGLNHTGTTGGQANMVALNQLYSGSGTRLCAGRAGPSVYWAYNATNHSGTVTTSPVLSEDGSEVIYVESTSSASYLHVLVWHSADGGTVSASKAPTNSTSAVSSCPSGASCLVTTALGTHAITRSAPFYDYAHDVVYVGDDNGTLYEVTPVLGSGTPAVSTLTVSSGNRLTGPVLDYSSGDIFVGSSNGNPYAVKSGTFALETHSSLQVGESGCTNAGLIDSPLVDSTNGMVFATSMVGADGTHNVVVQAATTGANSPGGATWSAAAVANVGEGDSGCNSSATFYAHSPIFDNTYYTTPAGGHLLVGGTDNNTTHDYPALWSVTFSGTPALLTTATEFTGTGSIPRGSSTNHDEISPLTEIYQGSTDYLFFGVGGSSYTGLFGFRVSGGAYTAISGSPITTYPHAQGGTSAIVIDNVSNAAQASSIYFTTLATSTTVCGSSSAYCAVKLTQSALR
jgi:hypothetical protein